MRWSASRSSASFRFPGRTGASCCTSRRARARCSSATASGTSLARSWPSPSCSCHWSSWRRRWRTSSIRACGAVEMPVLSVRGLSIDYSTRNGPARAVREVSFDLEKSETLAIIGESGSGKTTLAVGLIRLSPRGAKVTAGQILYTSKDGITRDVRAFEEDDLREYRWAECAMVFQAALNSFNPVITIWDQFLDTGRAHGLRDNRKVHERASELLDLVHLDPRRVLPAYPHELSGGMKQRVLIAMSLMLDPQIVILDEPTTALDILTQRPI